MWKSVGKTPTEIEPELGSLAWKHSGLPTMLQKHMGKPLNKIKI